MRDATLHAFLIWSSATAWSDEIVGDLGRRFELREVHRVTWSPEHFASNLSRLYGDTLPPGSAKEKECGTGPFLVAVVADPSPNRAIRRTTRGFRRVNANVFDARRRYRELAGGGYRVHATLDDAEADKDLLLILGRRRAELAAGAPWAGGVAERRRDLLGTDGWDDERQLVEAIEVCGGCSVVGGAGDASGVLELLVGDPWWAERIAHGTAEPQAGAPVRIGAALRHVELRAAAAPQTRRLRWNRLRRCA